MFWTIISTFLRVILWLSFAFFGISYHRILFNRKTENAHGCFTCRSVLRIPLLQAALSKLRNEAKMLRVIYSYCRSINNRIIFCYRRGADSHSRGDFISIRGNAFQCYDSRFKVSNIPPASYFVAAVYLCLWPLEILHKVTSVAWKNLKGRAETRLLQSAE